MSRSRCAFALILASLAAAGSVAEDAPPGAAPSSTRLRSVEVRGILEGKPVRLRNGVYVGAPYAHGGAERPRVELLSRWTAAGNLDARPGDERIVLLSETSGGTGVRVYLSAFGERAGRIENLGTVLVGDRVSPTALSLDGRTIVLDVTEAGPGDPSCCPTLKSRRSYRLGPGGLTELADVPFELIHGQIVLRVAIGRIDGLHFLLDTSASPSVIDYETSARLGLFADVEPTGEVSGTGNGSAESRVSRITGLRVGAVDVAAIDAVALDLSQASRRLGVEIAGILGNSFLQGRIVELDYPRRRLRLHPDLPAYPETSLIAPLRTVGDGRAPLIEHLVKVDGKSIPVTLDTGSSFALEAYPSARSVLGPGLWTTPGRVGHVTGALGEATVRHVTVGSIAIGPHVLDTRDLTLSRTEEERGGAMGNLGNSGLESFVVILDYVGGRIVFSRPPTAGSG